jgi:hypothetical protein
MRSTGDRHVHGSEATCLEAGEHATATPVRGGQSEVGHGHGFNGLPEPGMHFAACTSVAVVSPPSVTETTVAVMTVATIRRVVRFLVDILGLPWSFAAVLRRSTAVRRRCHERFP